MSDLTELIRNALKERDSATAAASADLHEVTRQFSEAISAITNGAATLSLDLLNPTERFNETDAGDAFALLLEWNQDQRIIRVLELSAKGYPIQEFKSSATWQIRGESCETLNSRAELESYFRQLVSARDSDVVTMLRFIIGNTPRQPAGAG